MGKIVDATVLIFLVACAGLAQADFKKELVLKRSDAVEALRESVENVRRPDGSCELFSETSFNEFTHGHETPIRFEEIGLASLPELAELNKSCSVRQRRHLLDETCSVDLVQCVDWSTCEENFVRRFDEIMEHCRERQHGVTFRDLKLSEMDLIVKRSVVFQRFAKSYEQRLMDYVPSEGERNTNAPALWEQKSLEWHARAGTETPEVRARIAQLRFVAEMRQIEFAVRLVRLNSAGFFE